MAAKRWSECWRRAVRSGSGLLLVSLLAVVLGACSSIDVEVHPAPDFVPARYHALAWVSPPLDARSDKALRALEQTVRKSVEKGLVAKGYPLLAADADSAPDLLIDYRWSRRVEPRGAGAVSPSDEAARVHDLDTTPAGDGALYRHPIVDTAERVTLRVSLRDAATRELVWWGSAATVAADAGDEEARALADRLLQRVLRELPPHSR